MLAQGIFESDSGNSRLSVQSNNHFGIKCKRKLTGAKVYHDDDATRANVFQLSVGRGSRARDHAEFRFVAPILSTCCSPIRRPITRVGHGAQSCRGCYGARLRTTAHPASSRTTSSICSTGPMEIACMFRTNGRIAAAASPMFGRMSVGRLPIRLSTRTIIR